MVVEAGNQAEGIREVSSSTSTRTDSSEGWPSVVLSPYFSIEMFTRKWVVKVIIPLSRWPGCLHVLLPIRLGFIRPMLLPVRRVKDLDLEPVPAI